MAIEVARWGGIIINDNELIDLNFSYGVRFAKFVTVYYYPIVQYVGRDITKLSFTIKTNDENKLNSLWTQKDDLVNNNREFILGGVSYGGYYLLSTRVNINQYETLRTDDLSAYITNSLLADFEISIEAYSESTPIL